MYAPVVAKRAAGIERGGAVRWGLVWAVFGVTVLVAMGVGAYLYFVLMRYERVAAHHVPDGAQAAARWDVEQALLYEPLRRHLLPVLDEALSEPGSANPDGLQRLEAATRINLGRDLREVVVTRGPGDDDWMVALGGMFPRTGVLDGLLELLHETGQRWEFDAPHSLATGPAGLAVGRAEDGVLMIASSRKHLLACLPAQSRSEAMGLAMDTPGSLAIEPLPDHAREAELVALRAVLLLGTPIEIELVAERSPGSDRARAMTQIRTWITQGGFPQLGRAVLEVPPRLQATDLGPDRITARFQWERAAIDASAAAIASQLRERWHLPVGGEDGPPELP